MATVKHLPLPNKHVTPYIRLGFEPQPRKPKAMTIAAGFQCDHGFVLCADRQMSHGTAKDIGAFAHYEQKVFGTDQITAAAAVCGSGNDGSLIRPFSEAFFNELEQQKGDRTTFDITQTRTALEATLNDFTSKIGGIPDLSLLVAAVDEKNVPQFLRSDGLVIQQAREIEIMGIGETSLVRYLVDAIYKSSINLKELAVLAAFIVFAAKKYCPQYCGGQTDVWILPKNYMWHTIPLETHKINELDKMFETMGPEKLNEVIQTGVAIIR